MNIGRFYEEGLVKVIGDDKFGCQDTLEFEIKINEHYVEDKKEAEVDYRQFKPMLQKFKNLNTVSGVIDLELLTGLYDGPYTYNLTKLTAGPTSTIRNSNSFHNILFDNNSKKGEWNFEQGKLTFEVRPLGKKLEIRINQNGNYIKGQLIKLDASVLRILYSNGDYQKIEEFYRVN